jgi:uncharacterized lipoprotein YajG
MNRRVALLPFLAAMAALAGCETEPYCVNCTPIDGSVAGAYDVRPVEVIVANPDRNNKYANCDRNANTICYTNSNFIIR